MPTNASDDGGVWNLVILGIEATSNLPTRVFEVNYYVTLELTKINKHTNMNPLNWVDCKICSIGFGWLDV